MSKKIAMSAYQGINKGLMTGEELKIIHQCTVSSAEKLYAGMSKIYRT
ncbi:hypothetical protein KK062_10415 [Fulvivirgaceae bacterium PWU5]|uniref:Uncharacterized protein n=1 Tax=Dawidia cretensis TaxID=2782350 RepID=A0AAP2DWI4_9BACT|nr:hypothetical protein [Dawidia cretensis]MBT1708640.1 hypothetical protein [Dawidia cretensis]